MVAAVTFSSLVSDLTTFLSDLIPLVVVLALLYFLWGAVQFIRADDKTRGEARTRVIYGLVGLFVMVSVWGLVGVLSNTLNLDNTLPTIPSFQ